ncbi:MAG: hypothetical protein DDT21_00969 [Syntrophomonadaceae bacterium]|nr:hypothetical protein [Bacillota bacterium]
MTGTKKDWYLTLDKEGLRAELLVRAEAQVGKEELLEAIRARGICYGLLPEAVDAALVARDTSVPLARGEPPLPGKDAQLKLHVAETMLSGDTMTSVGEDLRLQVRVPAVEAGTLLAEVSPPSAGKPGTDIFGQEIKPPPPRQLHLRALQGTVLSAEGTKVTAAITGRARMERKNYQASFIVQPCFTHRGDVTAQTSMLSFRGDIAIFGNVTEGTTVTATGSITVHGNISGARLDAGQHATITGNVIQGTITAGYERLITLQALPLLEEVETQIAELANVSRQLTAHASLARVPFPHLVRQLIQARYGDLPERLEALRKTLRADKTEASTTNASQQFRKIWPSLQPDGWLDQGGVYSAAQNLLELKQLMESVATQGGIINVVYLLNSKLQAGRTIMLKGQGCMYSELEAGEDIQVHGRLRSSKVVAQNYIFAREVGSEAGAFTELRVSSSGRIEIDRAYENTMLSVGDKNLKVTDTTGRSKTSLDKDGRLVLIPRF